MAGSPCVGPWSSPACGSGRLVVCRAASELTVLCPQGDCLGPSTTLVTACGANSYSSGSSAACTLCANGTDTRGTEGNTAINACIGTTELWLLVALWPAGAKARQTYRIVSLRFVPFSLSLDGQIVHLDFSAQALATRARVRRTKRRKVHRQRCCFHDRRLTTPIDRVPALGESARMKSALLPLPPWLEMWEPCRQLAHPTPTALLATCPGLDSA